jgi:acyl phosphate:glycerol-3-phosphate acyltransferase
VTAALLLLAGVVGYAAGSVSTATIVARRRGVDLRTVGSGNPGATNVGRALGRRAGVAVALLDVAKGALPAAGFGVVDHRAGLVAGVLAVLGHVTSPLLRGRGGRGVATAAGAVIGSHPLWAPIVLLVWVVVVAASRWVTLASVSAALAVVAVSLVVGEDLLWAAALALVVLVRHQPNLARRLEWRRPPPLGAEED